MDNVEMEDIVRGGVNAKLASELLAVRNTPDRFSRTGYDAEKRTAYLGAPFGDDAGSRTTRIKEQLVANAIGPVRFSEGYSDLVKDTAANSMALRHKWPADMPRRACRDAVAHSMRKLRAIAKASNDGRLSRIETWQHAVCEAVEAVSVTNGRCNVNSRIKGVECPGYRNSIAKANKLLYQLAGSQYGNLLAIAGFDCIATKAQQLSRFIGPVAGNKPSEDGEPTDKDAEFGDEEGTVMVLGGIGGQEQGYPLEIIHPRRHVPTDATVKHRAYARSGAVIRSCRLAPLIATGSMSTLFVKTRRRLGGAILIDASGSMGLTAAFLESVCMRLPAATIAYYSGDGGGTNHLVIHAKDGRRADHIKESLGGNECDYHALQWLLKQQGPRAFVTDGQFCGGYPWQAQACHALLKTAIARRQVTWHLTLHDLEDAGKCFGGRTT